MMISKPDLMGQALDRYGFFVRVSDPDESEVGFGASYVDDRTTTAIGTTRTPAASYTVTVLPAASRPHSPARVPYEHPVDVYLDGAFLRTSAWQRDYADIWPDAWLISLRASTDLEIVVRTASEPAALPTELALARDRPSPAPQH